MVDMRVKIGSVTLENPIMPASGCFSTDLAQVIDLNRLGALVAKTVSREFRAGNPPPRVSEVEGGMINSIGLPTKGIEYFLSHQVPDYNGHYGIGAELCGICPLAQIELCRTAHKVPTAEAVRRGAAQAPGLPDFDIEDITERAVTVSGLDEQPRYYLQHSLGFQVHDVCHPHNPHRHGRAEIGWSGTNPSTPGAS